MSQLTRLAAQGADIPNWLAAQGRVFVGSDASLSGTITGTDSFATTTPMLLLDVPDGTAVIPLEVSLYQTGDVAGGVFTVFIEKDNADRYTSGGTSETVYNDFGNSNNATLYSNSGTAITATDAYGIPLMQIEQSEDVGEAATEFSSREIIWVPSRPLDIIKGAGAFLVHAYAATTGPTFYWHVKWAEVPEAWV